jgi:hypothetical protein
MDLALYWKELWRYMEFSYYQLWDIVTEEGIEHPVKLGAIALIPFVLWWVLKRKD